MSRSVPRNEQLLDLLIQNSTAGLSDAEAAELERLLREQPEFSADEMDEEIAALTLALSKPERMPDSLAARILAAAPSASEAKTLTASSAPSPSAVTHFPTRARWAAAGWWAAAACLILAIAGWWPRLIGEQTPIAQTPVVTPDQARAALLASGRAIQASWSPGGAGTDALLGDVVFDPITQRGYLRFRGIPVNDPRLQQYQLWIADTSRNQPEPVDGGVFDINSAAGTPTGDVIIPFEAKLPVGSPAAFVVTVEQPGGVVVSKQEKVLALAKVQS